LCSAPATGVQRGRHEKVIAAQLALDADSAEIQPVVLPVASNVKFAAITVTAYETQHTRYSDCVNSPIDEQLHDSAD